MFNVKKISAEDFLKLSEIKDGFQLVINAVNSEYLPEEIPYIFARTSNLEKDIELIRKDVPVIIACDHGETSFFMASNIKMQYENINVSSLQGGLISLKSTLDNHKKQGK